MAVKMRPTHTWTKRPRGALLQLDTGKVFLTVERRREGRTIRCIPSMEHLSLKISTLIILPHKNPAMKHCLVGSLTGEVASKKVTEAYKGWLSADGNRAGRTKAKASLTARGTSRAGAKAGLSDPRMRNGCAAGLTDKSYPGDNRLIASERPQRRCGLAPRCRLSAMCRGGPLSSNR